ncbi:MAG: hypothetical protein ACOCPM_02070 [Bacteroidales bacterium]
MKYLINIILGLVFLVNIAVGQEKQTDNDTIQDEKDDGYSGSVIVKGKHNPRISDAVKILKNPEMDEIEVDKEPVDYTIRSERIPVEFELDKIRPANMVGEPLEKLYNNHMRIAMGTSTMPYLEYFYNTTRSRDNSFGIHLKHFSASGDIDNHPFPGFSDNLANVNYKKIWRNHVLKANAGYERNVVHSYGIPEQIYDTITDFDKEDIKLLYNRVDASIDLQSKYSDYNSGKLHHSVDLDFYHFSDNEEAREMNFDLNADMHSDMHFLEAADEQTLGVELTGDYMMNTWNSLDPVHSVISSVSPYLKNKFKNIDLDVGLSMYVDADSVATRNDFYPDIHLKMELIKNIFILKGGLTGKTTGDNLNELTKENPFLYSSYAMSPLKFQYHRSIIYAGLSASISKNIDFNAYFESSDTENASFFIRDTTSELANRYNLIHDNVRSFDLKAEVDYHLQEKLNVSLGAKYSEYSITNLEEAWNRPAIEGYLKARYDIQDKIILKGEVFYIGERKALGMKDSKFQTVSLEPVIDANISAEYRYNKLLSGFISFRNLAAQQYEKWAGYPTYGFQFMAGLTYSM